MTARRERRNSTAPAKAERPALVPQSKGGALLTGGVPGHKGGGGRPPDEFKRILAHLSSREETVTALGKILKNPDHPHFMKAQAYVSDRGYPDLMPAVIAAKMRASEGGASGPPTINFVFTNEGKRYDNVKPEDEVKPKQLNGNGNGNRE